VNVVHDFCKGLARDMENAASGTLVGVYLHGSAVLGDWNADGSDVDVLVVASRPTREVLERLASVLAAAPGCPGIGLETSVVERDDAANPRAPWPFLLHVTTAPADRKTVWGNEHDGDTDLILHYAVTRELGWAAYGPAPAAAFGEVPHEVVLAQLARELDWAVEHAAEPYAVLNACRALRYRDEGVICSKTAGGRWALEHRLQPVIVRRALDARASGSRPSIADDARAFVLATARELA